MFKFTFIIGFVASLVLTGYAPLPEFQPQPLSQEAKSLVFSQNKPYGCMLIGEVEGNADKKGTSGATADLLKTSAKNELRNNAAHLITLGENRRFLVYVKDERKTCHFGFLEVKCEEMPEALSSYKAVGEVYECRW